MKLLSNVLSFKSLNFIFKYDECRKKIMIKLPYNIFHLYVVIELIIDLFFFTFTQFYLFLSFYKNILYVKNFGINNTI